MTSIAPVSTKIKYINNKELLLEIHNSKKTFCSYVEPEHANYDTIVRNVSEITPELIEAVREKKSKPRGKPAIPIETILPESIVVRVMTYEHIPLDPDRVRKSRVTDQSYARTSFPPFKHYILLEDGPKEVCRSHWTGGFDNGHFVADGGRINNRLARMFILLVERYGRRGNWRGYCLDQETEALTQRGWLKHDEITDTDIVLSYDNGQMKWSNIKSIYRDQEYDGKMFKMTSRGFDALVTPGHKWVIKDRGGVKTEHLKETDRLVLIGDAVDDNKEKYFSDELVEFVGWAATEGNFYYRGNSCRLSVYQNEGQYSDRIRHCLTALGQIFSETHRNRTKNTNITFNINAKFSKEILNYFSDTGNKAISPEFITKLTLDQRKLLIETMIDADGWRTEQNGSIHIGYAQKDKAHLDSFVMLCTLAGYRTSTKRTETKTKVNNLDSHINVVTLLGPRANLKRVENIDMHGAKQSGRHGGKVGLGKENHPNIPTTDYQGTVWCLETEYGSFMCRRNGRVYLTHNSYNDEMQSQSLLQLSQIGLQFDESKSDNPFAFYTTAIRNCLAGDTEILTKEFGSVAIEEVSEKDVTLLDGNGNWVKCHIYDHGIQETQLNYFQDGFGSKVGVRSTLNHGWVGLDGQRINTSDFDGHTTKIADLRPSKIVQNEQSYRDGIVHGIVYGDGSAIAHGFKVRLCGEKNELAKYFEGYKNRSYPSYNGDIEFYHIKIGNIDLKKLPTNPGADTDYLLGFIRGWMTTDGCVSLQSTPTLCGDDEEYTWIKKWGPVVGWHVNGRTKLSDITNYGQRNEINYNFHIAKGSLEKADLIRSKHAERWNRPNSYIGKQKSIYDWDKIEQYFAEGKSSEEIANILNVKVTALRSSISQRKKRLKEVENFRRSWIVNGSLQPNDRRMERVYCPFVETTNTFALSKGIHLWNCFIRIVNQEKKSQNIRDDLLIVSGTAPSYTRQIDNELEYRFPSEHKPTPVRKAGAPKKSDKPLED